MLLSQALPGLELYSHVFCWVSVVKKRKKRIIHILLNMITFFLKIKFCSDVSPRCITGQNDIISKGGITIKFSLNSKMKNFITKIIRHGQTTEINFIQLSFFCKASMFLKHVQDLKTTITLNSICNTDCRLQNSLNCFVQLHVMIWRLWAQIKSRAAELLCVTIKYLRVPCLLKRKQKLLDKGLFFPFL